MAVKSRRKTAFWVLFVALAVTVTGGAIALISQTEPVPMAPGPSYHNETPEEVL